MVDRLGQQLGNYRLVHLIGQGGFADVYLGEHIHLNSQAAIKVLQMRLVGSALEQFRDEGRAIASLVHPNIVRVFDFGVDDGIPYLVMDYAPNGTLRQRYPKGALLSPATILPHFMQVARALQYAHDRKLMHRDIKPENMLLGSHNEVLLSDFGLALPVQSAGSQSVKEMAGTLPYMAPEQINGRPGFASDQYALGVVLYEWLSGDRPFQGPFIELASQHMMTPPPPLYPRIPGLSRAVEEVLFIALAKDPLKRFDRIETFATAFEQACQQTRADSTAFPTVISSRASSSDSPNISSSPHLSGQYTTEEATYIPPGARLMQQSARMATPRDQLAPVAPAGETAQSTYIMQPSRGRPAQSTSVMAPGNTPGVAAINTPPGYSALPLSSDGTPGQYHHAAGPDSTTQYPTRGSRRGPVFASILIVALALLLISGGLFFLPKALSSMQGASGSTLAHQANTKNNTVSNTGTVTRVTSPVVTPTHAAGGSVPTTPTTTVTSVPTTNPTTPVTSTGPAITDFAGTWYNIDPNTRSWVRVEISAQNTILNAHFFGACTPTPCDAGSTSTSYSGSPVSMTLTESFAVLNFTLTLNGNTLHVTTFTHFTDNSGRQDFTSQDDFTTTQPTPVVTPTVTVTPTGPTITDFVGVWQNVDPNTRDWVQVQISAQGNTLTAHFFGACTPTPCDAGSTSTTFNGSPVQLQMVESFATRTFTLTLNSGILHITTFTHFTDNSGRQDYTIQDDFHQ